MRISSLFVLCLALTMSLQAPAAEPAAKIKTLLVTGDDIGPFHDWRENSEASREALEVTGRFEVRVCEDPSILESKTALDTYDVIVFVLYNHTLPDISDAAKENLVNFVKGGKGFVSTHLSSASFKDWEEYGKLVGRKWVMGVSGHNPRNVFEAKIANSNHPITKGLKDFKIFDELYANLQGSGEIETLVTAESDFTNKTEPLLFVLNYGKGRVVHDAFGHDRKAILDPNHRILFTRSCEWAATGRVAEGG